MPGTFLARIPFQALRDQEGRYLIEKHPLVYSAALRYVSDSSVYEPLTSSKTRVLAVANALSSHGAHLSRLPDAAVEAEDVAKHFEASVLIENTDATLANISRNLARVGVFHFAGHTGSVGGHKGLLLAETPDERETPPVLDLFVLERLNISNLKLVVLSSCSTGREDQGDEAAPEDLAQGFVQLGVRRVVATHWDLDSSSGATLMRKFYGSLLSGKTVAQAMAASEAQMMYAEPHPYYWAVYDVFGRQ